MIIHKPVHPHYQNANLHKIREINTYHTKKMIIRNSHKITAH